MKKKINTLPNNKSKVYFILDNNYPIIYLYIYLLLPTLLTLNRYIIKSLLNLSILKENILIKD
jgi:hypothetical protein